MMMKRTILFLFLLFSVVAYEQSTVSLGGPITVNGQIVGGANKKMYLLNQNMGGLQSPVAVVTADNEGKFLIQSTIAVRDYYFLRLENGQALNLIIQPNDSITIFGDAKDLLTYSNIKGSTDTELMSAFLRELRDFKKVEDSLRKVVMADRSQEPIVNTYFSPIAQNFYSYRSNFINTNIKSPALLATLNSFDQNKEWDTYKQIVAILNQSFGDSPTIQNMVRYVVQKDGEKQQAALANQQKEALFKPGTLAREISLPDTSGNMINLSDLKGKVVLIDFWASWCGPCRRENPNVVNAYKKYNADGFEVFSVSLDKAGQRDKWIAAIKQDGLIWSSHVSSLEGFNTSAARDYMVNSIPFTVLIDAEGKVIATNLRGAQLEAELKRIFGH